MEISLLQYIIAILGGFVAGCINTLAGNGSAITLTILTEIMGLPPNVANGTNRVGVVTQGMASSIPFYRSGKLDIKRNKLPIIFIFIGAIIGVLLATWVSNEQFKQFFKFMMVFMFFIILIKPKRWLIETDTTKTPNLWLAIPMYLALGIYGGFIQMGMGIFFLVVMVLGARYSLIDANAIKAFVVALYTIFVLAIFHYKGLVDWRIGAILASGQTVGGWLTAKFATEYPNANVWAYRVLVIVVIAAILRLFGVFDYLF